MSNSLLLPPDARIRFVPDPHINCTKTSVLSFKLWDQSSGTVALEYWYTAMGNGFDPTLINTPGGEYYGAGLHNQGVWPMMMPAILNGALNR